MPHATLPSFSKDPSPSMDQLSAMTSNSGGPVSLTSPTLVETEYEPRHITPSHNDVNDPRSADLPPSIFLVKLRNAQRHEESSMLPGVKSDFIPSGERYTAPIPHKAKMDDFVKKLVLLDTYNANDEPSEQALSVASYIEDKDGRWHPGVRVSRYNGKKEAGITQMYVTVGEPSIVETRAAEAERWLSAQEQVL
jgi:hypothetical protein